MLHQIPIEAVYSATFVEHYLDCVENFPDELQRLISRMRELDICYLARVRDAAAQTEHWKKCQNNVVKKKRTLTRMQQALIAAQELGDEKLNLLQVILDKIEVKTRLLDKDFKTLDVRREDSISNENRDQNVNTTTVAQTPSTNSAERPNKRARRTRQDTASGQEPMDTSGSAVTPEASKSQPLAQTTTNTNLQKKTTTGKKKKRKMRQSAQVQRDESPIQDEPIIDPDEPTYCLCDQISYGEMIMCDNDLCPIEWFHFSCVTLNTKPKGKWYCPKCRGDRPNTMKPKAQFLRELERYNKDKEEKT